MNDLNSNAAWAEALRFGTDIAHKAALRTREQLP